MSRTLKRLLKWSAWISGGFMLLLVLFLTVPGIEGTWTFPSEENPWLRLQREKLTGADMRQASVGGFKIMLLFVDRPIPVSPGKRGSHWDDGVFWYLGERWLFSAGTKVIL